MVFRAALVLVVIVPMLGFAEEPVPEAGKEVGWFKRVFGKLSWSEVQSVVETPREASAAVRQNIRYVSDLGDTWTDGEETWNRGSGDCEDLAAVVVEMVHNAGGEASIIVFHPENSGAGHAVATGTWKGRKWISSNGFYYSVKSLDHAKALVAREMGWQRRQIVVEPADLAKSGNTAVASRQSPAAGIVLPGASPWK